MIGSGMSVLACSNSQEDCEENRTCTGPGGPGATTTASGSSACVPGPGGGEIANDCGVFISLGGDDNNDGSQGAPVQTFAKAVELAGGKSMRIYACAEEFKEAVTVPAGVSIYGGLDCSASWKYVGDATKTRIVPAADMVAITVSGGGETTHLADIEARAADATLPGGSSVAVVVDGATADLVRMDLIAGAGLDGAKGITPTDPVGPSDPSEMDIRGNNGLAACTNAGADNPGAEAKTNALCPTSIGGAGGVGSIMSGMPGTDGVPIPDPNPDGWGVGGVGASAAPCKPGQSGLNGADGMPGGGAAMLGMLSASGIVGASGADGTPGSPGHGGGGGGGAKGKMNCGGGSGGSGGAGGCGGGGGKGGQAGGSSIALISLNATLTLTKVMLKTGAGGKGGDGGDGQGGGAGGLGGIGGTGMGTSPGCSGGQGGPGGIGGMGGGGRGGHSVGIASAGAAPTSSDSSFQVGGPGLGGAGADMAGGGAPGVQAEQQEF